jgi:anti-repressor protein
MQEVSEVTMQTPIEIALGVDKNGMTTARKLYNFLGLAQGQFARWAKTNIVDNEFATENEDFWRVDIDVEGNKTVDYRLTAHFAKKLSCKGNGARAEEAREYFTTVEEKTKEEVINRSKLSPQMQMLYAMMDEQAKVELEQKRQARQIERVEEKQRVLSETFENPSDKEDFKSWCKKCIKKIADTPKFCREHYVNTRDHDAWNESYARLSEKRACRLGQRVRTAREKAEKNGASQSKIKEITYLSIITEDKDLKPVYETVIKEMMLAYCVA